MFVYVLGPVADESDLHTGFDSQFLSASSSNSIEN